MISNIKYIPMEELIYSTQYIFQEYLKKHTIVASSIFRISKEDIKWTA